MGLNAGEIVRLSYSWPRPITTQQQCYEMIERLGLKRLYDKNQKKLRKGHHDRNIMYAFSKMTGQAMELPAISFEKSFRDATPHPRARFRPDLALRIGRYQFYVEVQLSKIDRDTMGGEVQQLPEALQDGQRAVSRVLFPRR